MYSDTLIVVISLIIMIIVGLVFRTCCLQLTKQRLSKLAINNNYKGGEQAQPAQEMEMSDIQ